MLTRVFLPLLFLWWVDGWVVVVVVGGVCAVGVCCGGGGVPQSIPAHSQKWDFKGALRLRRADLIPD